MSVAAHLCRHGFRHKVGVVSIDRIANRLVDRNDHDDLAADRHIDRAANSIVVVG